MAESKKITAHCPTCNKVVDKLRAGSVGIFSGKILYFCSNACKDLFAKSAPHKKSPPAVSIAAGSSQTPSRADEEPAIDLTDELVNAVSAAETTGTPDLPLIGEVAVEDEADSLPGGPAKRVRPKLKIKISYWSLSLIIITIQVAVVTLSHLFTRISLLNFKDQWIFLPLATGIILQVFQSLKGWNRGGLKISLDNVLILFGVIMFSIPFMKVFLGPSAESENYAAALLAPSGILIVVWIGRMFEEYCDGKMAKGIGLSSIYEDPTVQRFVREKGLGRPVIAKFSSVLATTTFVLSPLAAGIIVLWFLLFGGRDVLDEKMWVFASAVSISLCPRLFRNNIVISFFSGLLNGRRRGIRFLSESDFEKAAVVDAVIFRKRGGVADEKTRVIDMIKVGGIMEESLLSLCYSCQEGIKSSEIASAIIRYAAAKDVAAADIRLRRYYPSQGVHCTSPYGEIIIGSRSFLIENGISLAMVEEAARERERRGESVVFLSVDRKVQALFVLSNELRKTAASVCERLQQAGIVPVIISGDSTRTLESIADRIGIEQVRSEIPISRWAGELERIRDTGHRLAIVGKHPFKDKISFREDLVIEMEEKDGIKPAQPYETGVTCGDENLELVVDVIEIAGKSRKYFLVASLAALLTQVFATGIALSGLVSPLAVGGFVNIVAGVLWFVHPKLLPKEM